jgi:hypothetical protein
MPALPLAANSGQYLATGEYTSSSPRSTNTSAVSAVIVLVTDQVVVMVSCTHWVLRSMSAHPPHRSTRNTPFRTTASDAPNSSPASRFS